MLLAWLIMINDPFDIAVLALESITSGALTLLLLRKYKRRPSRLHFFMVFIGVLLGNTAGWAILALFDMRTYTLESAAIIILSSLVAVFALNYIYVIRGHPMEDRNSG